MLENNAYPEQGQPSVITAAYAFYYQCKLVLLHDPPYVVFNFDIQSHEDAYTRYSYFSLIVDA